jgi:hypothetical protein
MLKKKLVEELEDVSVKLSAIMEDKEKEKRRSRDKSPKAAAGKTRQ